MLQAAAVLAANPELTANGFRILNARVMNPVVLSFAVLLISVVFGSKIFCRVKYFAGQYV